MCDNLLDMVELPIENAAIAHRLPAAFLFYFRFVTFFFLHFPLFNAIAVFPPFSKKKNAAIALHPNVVDYKIIKFRIVLRRFCYISVRLLCWLFDLLMKLGRLNHCVVFLHTYLAKTQSKKRCDTACNITKTIFWENIMEIKGRIIVSMFMGRKTIFSMIFNFCINQKVNLHANSNFKEFLRK